MAQNLEFKTTYEAAKVIKPIFTRGNVALSRNGRILATCLDDDVILSNLHTGAQLAQIEGVSNC
jgi:U3 small nucleolar RNA-associated protein 13